jgi:coenzyme PQQ synthesis protein D (PqqD)
VTRLRQSPSTPWRRVGNEIILAPCGRDDFDRLSETASVVWSILETPCSLDDLVKVVAETYSVPAEGIAGDVKALADDLLARGTIEEVPDIHG